jgi:carbamoyl-phosphate synthase/aspartate carbamoyltransferase
MAQISPDSQNMALELQDGYVCFGESFGADKSIAGELVFQTGMVGYPESITDPSYRGQILVITFPLVGNYGVPSRDEMDSLLKDLPAYFEAKEIHIAGLVVASYAGDNYSHYLATSSLGEWLKEQGVPAITGVDTRALTKLIREEGSMLGRLMRKTTPGPASLALTNGVVNTEVLADGPVHEDWRTEFEDAAWSDPNKTNLVTEGDVLRNLCRNLH